MAQTGNQILNEILGVCVQINKKLDKKGGSSSGDGEDGMLSGIFGKKRGKQAKEGAKVIDDVFNSITRFSKVKINSKKINRTSTALKGLFKTIIWIGENQKRADSAISMIDKLGERLTTIAKTSKGLSMLMLSVGAAFVSLAGGIVLAGKLLGTSGALGAVGAMIGIITATTGAIFLLGKASKFIEPGSKTAKKMGEAFGYVGAGMVVLAMSVAASGKILGMSGPNVIATGIIGIIGMIGIMGVAFNMLGKFKQNILAGAGVAGLMAIGMAALGWGVTSLAASAKMIGDISSGDVEKRVKNKKGQEKGKFGQMMLEIGPGLGMIGIIMVSAASLFSILGIPVVAGLVALGSGVAIAMGVALNKIGKSVMTLSKAAKSLSPDFTTNVSDMISGLLGGIVRGLSLGLTGKEETDARKLSFRGVAKLNRGIRLLKRMSKAASLFAKSMTAFAKVNQMRVIDDYDKDGRPIFGEKVDVSQVSMNMSSTIKTFLLEMIDATDGLQTRQAAKMDRMARALTGRRGMLRAIIQFSKVLKEYSKYGPNGEIGYTYIDEKGKTQTGKVKIEQVVGNIITSFTKFVSELTAHSADFDISGKERRKMKKFGKILTGKKGMLEPIIGFAQAIDAYAKYGKDGSVPQFDQNGNPIIENGKQKTVPIESIAGNVALAFSSFANALSGKLGDIKKRDIRRAENKIKGFNGIISELNKLVKVTDGLDSTSKALLNLSSSMGELAKSIGELDSEKLAMVSKLGNQTFASKIGAIGEGIANKAVNIQTKIVERVETRREERQERREERKDSSTPAPIAKTSNEEISKEINKQMQDVLQTINDSLSSAFAEAFKNTQFTFDFQGENKGVLGVS